MRQRNGGPWVDVALCQSRIIYVVVEEVIQFEKPKTAINTIQTGFAQRP